jgi:hypothetical protein
MPSSAPTTYWSSSSSCCTDPRPYHGDDVKAFSPAEKLDSDNDNDGGPWFRNDNDNDNDNARDESGSL